jgi:potassium efflux system protein
MRGVPRALCLFSMRSDSLLRRCLLLLILVSCPLWLGAPALAVDLPTSAQEAGQARDLLEQASTRLGKVRSALTDADSAETFKTLAERALQSQRDADESVRRLSPALEQLDARIAQLGEAGDAASEGRDLSSQRKELAAERNTLDTLIKQGNLLSVEARQLAESVEKLRVQQLNQQLSLRVESPLSPLLWQKVLQQLPDDFSRTGSLLRQGQMVFSRAVERHGWGWPLGAAALSLLMVLPLRLWLRRAGRAYAASERAPAGRLRRSGLAVWLLLVGTLLPGFAAVVMVNALTHIDAIAPRLASVAQAFVTASFLAAFIASLSACLLVPSRPSWRLLPIDDIAAARLRKYAWMAASLMWVTGVAIDGVLALSYIGLILAMLMTLARLNRRQQALAASEDQTPAQQGKRSGWMVLMRVVGHMTVIAALLAALFGYINLAMFAAQQMIWIGVVVLALVLLLKFADDLAVALFNPDSRSGKAVMLASGLGSARLEQGGVLLSAVLRLALVMLAIAAITAPQGNSNLFVGWLDTLRNGISLGDTVLRPTAFVRAVLVMLVALAVTGVFQRWLVDTYLPKTELDVGGRNSISTVSRYVGLILVGLWTLAALGLGFEKLALVVSALSVGIGFGLQAITQNFVSGLILLAERPVKIGDWVKIGDQEGDIRRISVRSTEIQVGDKSTLIVPNSELITKTIRNMTMANPMGRVQIKFQVPLSTDVARLKELLLGLYAAHPGVLEEPAPAFYVDSLDGGMITINSFGHVGSPRNTYSVRSDLLFELLTALAAADIPLATPADVHLVGGLQQPGGN